MAALTTPKFYRENQGELSVDGLGWVWQCNVFAHYCIVRTLFELYFGSHILLSFSSVFSNHCWRHHQWAAVLFGPLRLRLHHHMKVKIGSWSRPNNHTKAQNTRSNLWRHTSTLGHERCSMKIQHRILSDISFRNQASVQRTLLQHWSLPGQGSSKSVYVTLWVRSYHLLSSLTPMIVGSLFGLCSSYYQTLQSCCLFCSSHSRSTMVLCSFFSARSLRSRDRPVG